ncbi:MAG: hypothetical protein RJQ09_04265 [Cyclobacteriaceae bacterium]
MEAIENHNKFEQFASNQKSIKAFCYVFAFILYGYTISFEYALDDHVVLDSNNFVLSGISGIPDILTKDTFKGYSNKWVHDAVDGGRYRPLSLVTYAVEVELFGLNPHISHLINILFYGLTAFVFFEIILILFENKNGRNIIGFTAILLFLIHPLHTEVVANIKGRDEIFVLLFSLLSWKYALQNKVAQTAFWFGFAILSKENALMIIPIIGMSYYILNTYPRSYQIKSLAVICMVALIYLYIRFLIIGSSFDNQATTNLLNNPFLEATMQQRYGTILYTLLLYIKLIFVPYPLTIDYYPYHIKLINIWEWQAIMSFVLNIILLALGLKLLIKRNIYGFAIIIHFLGLFLVCNLIFNVGVFMAERFMYYGSIGFCLIGGMAFYELLYKRSNVLKWAPLLLLTIVFSVLTINRSLAWKNGTTLFNEDVITSDGSIKSHLVIASRYMTIAEGYKNMNQLQKAKDYTDSALYHLKRTEEVTDYVPILLRTADLYMTILNDSVNAAKYYEKVIDKEPTNPYAIANLGLLYFEYFKDYERAIIYYKENIKRFENVYLSQKNLGAAYLRNEQFQESLVHLVKAFEIRKDDPELYMFLSLAYLGVGDIRQSKQAFLMYSEMTQTPEKQETNE